MHHWLQLAAVIPLGLWGDFRFRHLANVALNVGMMCASGGKADLNSSKRHVFFADFCILLLVSQPRKIQPVGRVSRMTASSRNI
jgi:hypothetical protein